jgi:ethanolamine ammonia-lyase small subunit
MSPDWPRICITTLEERYQQAGLDLQTIELAEQGREPLAEKLVEEFHGGSRVDVVLVGAGLLCGLAASIWGTWLPSA